MQAAADWTGVLINMNTDNIKASLQRLHDGTVGNSTPTSTRPSSPTGKWCSGCKSRSRGEVEAVAFESVHHDLDAEPGRARAGRPSARLDRPSHRHGHGGGHLGQRERRRQAANRALEPAAGHLRRGRQADDLAAGVDPMRNAWRVLAFDVAAPLAAIAALLAIGVVLAWPAVVGVVVFGAGAADRRRRCGEFFLLRRDSVTVGTDDDAPGLRLAVVALCTAALVAAVLTGYRHWTTPDHDLKVDSAEVVRIATSMAEATATFSPQEPMASIDRAVAMMVPEQASTFKDQFGRPQRIWRTATSPPPRRRWRPALEALGPSAASVAVIMRGTQNEPGQPPSSAVLALRVTLTKQQGHWLVLDVSPLNPR